MQKIKKILEDFGNIAVAENNRKILFSKIIPYRFSTGSQINIYAIEKTPIRDILIINAERRTAFLINGNKVKVIEIDDQPYEIEVYTNGLDKGLEIKDWKYMLSEEELLGIEELDPEEIEATYWVIPDTTEQNNFKIKNKYRRKINYARIKPKTNTTTQ